MYTFEEAQLVLDELIAELPNEIFQGLNMGVSLLEDAIFDESGLIILGRYHYQPYGMGRYITVHYGSLMHLYGHRTDEYFRKKMKHVLHHELVHHLEGLAGDKSLEHQDQIDKAKYLRQMRKWQQPMDGGETMKPPPKAKPVAKIKDSDAVVDMEKAKGNFTQ